MREGRTWSKKLKAMAEKMYSSPTTSHEIFELVEAALEEGEQNVQDDPKKYNLGNCDDCEERRHADEPRHNEGYD